MRREPQVPRPSARALEVLLTALEDQAARSEDVRAALSEVQAWLGRVLPNGDPPGLREEVLVPAPDRRSLAQSATTAAAEESGPGARAEPVSDLDLVARRARWKADAVSFARERRAATGDAESPERVEFQAREAGLRERAAQLRDCATWWIDTPRRLPTDDELSEISSCYALLSRAAEVVHELEELGALDPAPPSELLYVLAEIQSALLASLAPTDQRQDDDQRDLFGWLKAQTTRHRIYVDRHMRLDDPAETGRTEERAARLERIRDALIDRHHQRRGRQRILGKVRYHMQKAQESGAACEQDHDAIEGAAREWCELGLAPGDPTLQKLAAEFHRLHGEGRVPGTFLARVLDAEAPQVKRPIVPRLDALEVLPAMLAGRTAVLFADAVAPDGGEALRRALGLTELRWVVLPEEPEVEARIAAEISAGDPGLILLGRRLEPDAYASFKQLCLDTQRPFVRLVQGYEPSRVAHQILRQIGWRLRASLAEQR